MSTPATSVAKLSHRLEQVDTAAKALSAELASVMRVLQGRTTRAARATEANVSVAERAVNSAAEAVDTLDQQTHALFEQAHVLHSYLGVLNDLAKTSQAVRRELFSMEIEASKLRKRRAADQIARTE